ncbi:MAG: urea transporter, partial [Nitrospinae bacterium]|nr:urea transporter [Nitrospinota bacterium]
FVLVTWLALIAADKEVTTVNYLTESQPIMEIFFKNIGYIVFSPLTLSGILILTGLFLYSRIMGFVTVLSFFAAIGFTLIFPNYTPFINTGSYNVILTSLAVAGIFFVLNPQSLLIGIAASLFTIIAGTGITTILSSYRLPVLTAPFNMITLLTLYLIYKENGQPPLYRVYIPLSPEENIKTFLREREKTGKAERRLSLPFMGWWFVSQGIDGRHTHKGIFKWGLDFIVTEKNKIPYKNDGKNLDDYYCYNMPVIAAGDGAVAAVTSSIPDNPVTTTNLEYNWGNHVILQHSPGIFSAACHLRQQDIQVKPGQIVKKGQIIGHVGSSGLSPHPHLHMQFQSVGTLGTQTIPVSFSDFLTKYNEYDEYIPSGTPEEEQTVMNIPVDGGVKEAVGFELGQRDRYDLNINGKIYHDEWLYDMDSVGLLFVESSLFKDRLYFYKGERSVAFNRYTGKRLSGLSALNIGIDRIPFYASDRLRFQKRTTYLELMSGLKSGLQELSLPFASLFPYVLKREWNTFLITHTFRPINNTFILSSSVVKGNKHIADRSIIFEHGIASLTLKTKGIECRLKRKL